MPDLVKHHMLIELDHTVPFPKPPKTEKSEPEIPEKWRKILRKYKPNWRLNELSQPKLITPKFVPTEESTTGVRLSALKSQCSMRVSHLARPNVRYLKSNRNYFKFFGKKFCDKMDRTIKSSWNSIYNYYKRSELEIAKRRSRFSLKSKSSKTSARSEKEMQEWIKKISSPKTIPEPEPLPPRPRKPLEDLLDGLEDLAKPKPLHGYQGPLDFPIPIKREALEYEMTEAMAKLAAARPARYKIQPPKEHPPGYVKRSALTYEASEVIEKLAIPKVKLKGNESDVREDAFVISPNALKYKATPRIQELAKPIERK